MKNILCIPFSWILLPLTLVMVACGSSDSSDPLQTDSNVVYLREDIVTTSRWTSGNIYVIEDGDFWVDATLEIEPGVIVKFTSLGNLLNVGQDGVLIAEGTTTDPIIFTSIKDDVGGDTNGDGDATEGVPGDWVGVNLQGTNGSIIDHCYFFYGGSDWHGTLEINYVRATVTNNLFSHNRGGPDGDSFVAALDATNAVSGTNISYNIFYDNGVPLQINASLSLDDSNTFSSIDGTLLNTYNGVFVDDGSDIETHISWEETEVAFVIGPFTFDIYSGATLSLGDDVVLKFRADSEMYVNDGESALINHDGAGVFFTSYKDDSHKGDTNGDGQLTNPEEGDWYGIYEGSYSDYLQWANILYDKAP